MAFEAVLRLQRDVSQWVLHDFTLVDTDFGACFKPRREYLKWAKPLGLLEIPVVDVVVVASCVVAPNGCRLGKGKGYGEAFMIHL